MTNKKLNMLHKIYRKLCRFKRSLVFVLTANCFFLYLMTNKIQSNEDQIEIRTNKFKYVVVHIDLKGAPPKLSFLKSMLQEVKMLGANALLMEYEDMFPYVNELKNLSKSEHYDINDLLVFLTEAKTIGVEIIPLIQTFGHMESVLKLQEFKHLREESSALDSICPSKLGTEILIGAMLRQVIEFHQIIAPLKHIHVGCDEVWTINKCDECKKREFQTHELFFRHLDTVVNLVTNASPNTTVLFWDDMMRRLSPTQLEELKMKSKLEPVVWEYQTRHFDELHRSLYVYHLNFNNIWIASAFKGADGPANSIPDYQKRTNNTLNWINFIKNYKFAGEREIFSFKGIALTGWSRYNHTAPLCDLLPVSYQSLVTSLTIIDKYQNGVKTEEINSIKWDKDNEVTFKNNFANDYYELVECQMTECILNSTLRIYNSAKHYKEFILNATKDLKLLAKYKDKDRRCYILYKNLEIFEEDIQYNMRPYYTWDVQNEYVQRSFKLSETIKSECKGYLFK